MDAGFVGAPVGNNGQAVFGLGLLV